MTQFDSEIFCFVELPRQIIGVVRDMRDGGLDSDPAPSM
jgi:hypothetical protein